MVVFTKEQFLGIDFGQASFSLTAYLRDPVTIATERAVQASLQHFAARIPPATRPPA